MLSFILLFCFVGCDDKDYSSDIDALKKELEETKAAVKTIDQACAKGIIHKNCAARKKSTLAALAK